LLHWREPRFMMTCCRLVMLYGIPWRVLALDTIDDNIRYDKVISKVTYFNYRKRILDMKKIVITGTSGLLGPYVVKHFLEQGYEVLSVDKVKPAEPLTRHMTADLTNLGECYGILEGAYAVIHLAAIPTAYIFPNEVTFRNNVMATYNILEAAAGLGITKAVIASS